MDAMATWVFWAAAGALLYAYAGFVVLVAAAGLVLRRRVAKAAITPPVTLIIAAYNEGAVIGERLDNALTLDYPADRLEIIVASDGSTDATNDIVARYATRGVRLLPLPRQGKIRALNAAVRQASGDVLVFSDANIMCGANAIRALVANFADPTVGGVAGRTAYQLEAKTESSGHGERLYWEYDTRIKELETWTGSVVSAHGGLYAVRRTLYQPLTDLSVGDDFAISTAVVEQGHRLVFEHEAWGTEFTAREARGEFRRRVRLMVQGLRGVILRWRLLNPLRYGFYSVVLVSHKVVRRLAPVFLLLLAAASAWLAPRSAFFLSVAAAQLAFYALALVGYRLRSARVGRLKVVYVPFYYCMANVACALALLQVLRGRRIELWQTERPAS